MDGFAILLSSSSPTSGAPRQLFIKEQHILIEPKASERLQIL
jgi:hypothetical protein